MAQKIYDAFGDKTLEILDQEPEKLLTIKGISEKKLEKICESYTSNRAARDVIAFLSPYGITPNRAVQLFKEYRDKTITTVRSKVKSIKRPHLVSEATIQFMPMKPAVKTDYISLRMPALFVRSSPTLPSK